LNGAEPVQARVQAEDSKATLVGRAQRLARHAMAGPLVAGLLARVVLITAVHHWNAVPLTSDDATYVHIATRLLETGRLETHHFPVGYPVFVAPFLALGAAAFPAIRGVHVLLGLATIVIVSRIARILYGERTGLFAAWLTALYPPLVFMTGRIMSETFFIALLVASLHQFLLCENNQKVSQSALAGALFGLASIVRSNVVGMLAYIPLWQLTRPRTTWRARIVITTASMLVAVTILMLPGLYFLVTKGTFIPFATNAGQTFYGANNPLADGGWVEVEDHPELLASIPPEVRRVPAAYGNAERQLGVKWIRENPGKFLSLLPKKLGNAWVPGFQSSETTSRSRVAAAVLAISLGLLLLTALLGRLRDKPLQRDGILLSVLAVYTVMSLAFYGNPRIGLFCAPILIVYSAAFVDRFLARATANRT
jgi:4-amino-4-deoxy-L-arabinose transferase-like glycosyltransferase